jgi:hypothetical protein
MAAKVDRNMRALKLLVIVMGVLLVAGAAALAVAIAYRLNHAAAISAAGATNGGSAAISLPTGAKIVSTEVSNGRIVARIDLPEGGVELMIFDLATGARISTVDLVPQPR